jgi:predicted SAM-dependent methyltransferase
MHRILNAYSMLRKIKHKIRHQYKKFKLRMMVGSIPLRIVIGASGVFSKGWIPTDIEQLNLLKLEDWRRYFQPDSIDAILAEHVWEHLSESAAYQAAKNCFFFLKPSGYIRVAVPDGYHPSLDYRKAVEPGGSGSGSDDHKALYNYRSLTHIFESAGFEVKLLEYFDEKGIFHRKDWHDEDGLINRSSKHDKRNFDGKLNYTSIIIDALKVK